ncbi:hypothetical protein ACGYQ5_14285 [Burkholderia pseudomallei]
MNDEDLHVDQVRLDTVDETGIYVLAEWKGHYGSFDIATLDTASLLRFCQRLDKHGLAVLVALLLGHPDQRIPT